MLGEMTDSTNRGQAFALWEVAFGIGTVFGPVLGGVLVNPVEQYPEIITSNLLKDYPYILPCIVSSIFSLIAAILAIFFMEESEIFKQKFKITNNCDSETQPLLNTIDSSSFNIDYQDRSLLSIGSQNKNNSLESVSERTVIDPRFSKSDINFTNSNLQISENLIDNSSLDSSAEISNENYSFFSHISGDVLLNIAAYALWCLVIVVYDEVYVLYVAGKLSKSKIRTKKSWRVAI